jgi:hypothetical protein
MKIEFDTGNLASMERLESDLDITLESVRLAIKRLREKGIARGQPLLIRQEERTRAVRIPRNSSEALADGLNVLGDQFTTRDLIDAARANHPHAGKVGILAALKAEVAGGRLEQIQSGAGRRPATYRKVNGAG